MNWIIFLPSVKATVRITLTVRFKICRLLRLFPLPNKVCSKYDSKLHRLVRLQFCKSAELGTLSLPLLPSPLRLGIVVPVRVQPIVQTTIQKLFVFSRNIWHQITKLFLSIIGKRSSQDIVANVLDCDAIVRSNSVHFPINTFQKGMIPFIPPAMGQIVSPLFFYKGDFGIK